MRSIAILGALALAAAPLSAQSGRFRTGDINPSTPSNRSPATIGGQVLGQEQQRQGESGRKSDRVPPGQLPPAGMCRIWIDGVPPGQQPAPTDCQTAVATKPANARVIFGGDGTSFPGKGNGKFNKNGKAKHDDRDDDDDDRETDRARRGGIAIGTPAPGASTQSAAQKNKGKSKGKGRG